MQSGYSLQVCDVFCFGTFAILLFNCYDNYFEWINIFSLDHSKGLNIYIIAKSACPKFPKRSARTTKYYANSTRELSARSTKVSTQKPTSTLPSSSSPKIHNILSCSTNANCTTIFITIRQSWTRASPMSTIAPHKVHMALIKGISM